MRKQNLADTAEGLALLAELDAYGHLSYTVSYGEEGDDEGDWMAAADFAVGKIGRRKVVAYEVVVNSESGGFVQTVEQGVVPADEAPFGLLKHYQSVGIEGFSRIKRSDERANDKSSRKFDADLRRALQR